MTYFSFRMSRYARCDGYGKRRKLPGSSPAQGIAETSLASTALVVESAQTAARSRGAIAISKSAASNAPKQETLPITTSNSPCPRRSPNLHLTGVDAPATEHDLASPRDPGNPYVVSSTDPAVAVEVSKASSRANSRINSASRETRIFSIMRAL